MEMGAGRSADAATPKWKRRATHSGDAPPMGVSFHRIDRRFEGRESATNNPRHHVTRRLNPT